MSDSNLYVYKGIIITVGNSMVVDNNRIVDSNTTVVAGSNLPFDLLGNNHWLGGRCYPCVVGSSSTFSISFFLRFCLKIRFLYIYFLRSFWCLLTTWAAVIYTSSAPIFVVLLKRADRHGHAERSFRIINTSNNISETFYFVWEIISSFFLWLCKKNIREIHSKFSGHFFAY